MSKILPFCFWLLWNCSLPAPGTYETSQLPEPPIPLPLNLDDKSWTYFLEHLPEIDSPVLDYRGKAIAYQEKHTGIIPYDVGTTDLQQCADALIRLRAEYLFSQHRFNEIGFHFVSGQYYAWKDYCQGIRPVFNGKAVRFIRGASSKENHESLRQYLDLVYTYASTISLAKELKEASGFAVGTVIIHPGSPGHCMIIIDEMINKAGEHFYKLAEGYTPAQSIYVLRNLITDGKSPWYHLQKGVINTASYTFSDYQLKKFE